MLAIVLLALYSVSLQLNKTGDTPKTHTNSKVFKRIFGEQSLLHDAAAGQYMYRAFGIGLAAIEAITAVHNTLQNLSLTG